VAEGIDSNPVWGELVELERPGERLVARLVARESTPPRGRLLSAWLDQGGWTIDFPDFRDAPVSLQPWRGRPLDATYIEIRAIYLPFAIYDETRREGRDAFAEALAEVIAD
jgi:hypothetical protein